MSFRKPASNKINVLHPDFHKFMTEFRGPGKYHRNQKFIDDLGMDSLDAAELIAQTEGHFGVSLDDDDESQPTLGKFFDRVKAKQASMNTEQAFINGFIKRANEYGLNVNAAVGLLEKVGETDNQTSTKIKKKNTLLQRVKNTVTDPINLGLAISLI